MMLSECWMALIEIGERKKLKVMGDPCTKRSATLEIIQSYFRLRLSNLGGLLIHCAILKSHTPFQKFHHLNIKRLSWYGCYPPDKKAILPPEKSIESTSGDVNCFQPWKSRPLGYESPADFAKVVGALSVVLAVGEGGATQPTQRESLGGWKIGRDYNDSKKERIDHEILPIWDWGWPPRRI